MLFSSQANIGRILGKGEEDSDIVFFCQISGDLFRHPFIVSTLRYVVILYTHAFCCACKVVYLFDSRRLFVYQGFNAIEHLIDEFGLLNLLL